MKPLTKFNDNNKKTFFSLSIYNVMEEIESSFKKWIENVFVEQIVSEDIYTNNLLTDIDYLLSKAIWILQHAESLGHDMTDNRNRLEFIYERYVSNELGYRNLFYVSHYDAKNHKYLNKQETKEREVKNNERLNRYVTELKNK